MNETKLQKLAALIVKRNAIAAEIAKIIGRPAEKGHVGEFIASEIFDIKLQDSATSKAIDGHFRSGSLATKAVNVKWYPKREGMLDIAKGQQPDFYLVLTGPKSAAVSSKGTTRPWLIESVYLFEAAMLVQRLGDAGVQIGTATSVRAALWGESEVYPQHNSQHLKLSPDQVSALRLFGPNPT